jgi:hypothetical protein
VNLFKGGCIVAKTVSTQDDLHNALAAGYDEITLGGNISLDKPWVTVPAFPGALGAPAILNGNGHTIGERANPMKSPLIAYAQNIVIKDLNIWCDRENEVYDGNSNNKIGSLIDEGSNVTLLNCRTDGYIKITAEQETQCYVGGLVGAASGTVTIDDCTNYINIEVHNSTSTKTAYNNIGGIAGSLGSALNTVINCKNYGDITIEGNPSNLFYVGGISAVIGTTNGDVHGCTNYGNITSVAYGIIAGVFSNVSGDSTLYDLVNEGKIDGAVNAAGICNQCQASLRDCINRGAVSSSANNAAGIVFNQESYCKVNNCTNNALITGFFGASGVAFYASSITNCANTNDVTTSAPNGEATGIVFHVSQGTKSPSDSDSVKGEVKNCHNTGNITSAFMASGIVGRASGSDITDCYTMNNTIGAEIASGIFYSVNPYWRSMGGGGYFFAESPVTDCTNYSTIRGKRAAAGIGYTIGKITVDKCTNNGEVLVGDNAGYSFTCYASGIVSYAGNTYNQPYGTCSIENCVNNAPVKAAANASSNCTCSGVLAVVYVSNYPISVKTNENHGLIYGTLTAAGIVGETFSGREELRVLDNLCDSDVLCQGGNAGGIIGSLSRTATVAENVIRSKYIGRSDLGGKSAATRGSHGYGAGGLIGTISVNASVNCGGGGYSPYYAKTARSGGGTITCADFYDIEDNSVNVGKLAGYIGVRRLIGFFEPNVTASGSYSAIPSLRYFPTTIINMQNNIVNENMLLIGNNTEDPFNKGLDYAAPGETVRKFDPDLGQRSMQGGYRVTRTKLRGFADDGKTRWQPTEDRLKFLPYAPVIDAKSSARASANSSCAALSSAANAIQNVLSSTASIDGALGKLLAESSRVMHNSAACCDTDSLNANAGIVNSILENINNFELVLNDKLKVSTGFIADVINGDCVNRYNVFIETKSLCLNKIIHARYIVTNNATGESQIYATDDEGIVKLPLEPGEYSVVAEALDGETLDTGRTLTVDDSGFHLDGYTQEHTWGVTLIVRPEICPEIPCS